MDYLFPELGINHDSAHVVMATHGGPHFTRAARVR